MPTPTPTADEALVPWCQNWVLKFPTHGLDLGFSAAEITSLVDDANSLAYALGIYYPAMTAIASSATGWKNGVKSGDPGALLQDMPSLPTLPTPPTGATFKFGARTRLAAAVARCKKSPNDSDAVEADLMIATPPDPVQQNKPSFTGTGLGGGINRLDWFKSGWTGVKCRMRRKGDASWTFDLGIDLQSPLLDKTPMLDPTKPEIREYQMQYLDGDEPTGDWSDIVSVTTT